jgi:uncharacterized membrane protein (DUF2068 family)
MQQVRARVVVAIGVFRLVKACALTAIGIGGLVEMPQDLARGAERAVAWMGAYSARATLERAIGKLWATDESALHRLAIVSLCYAAVFAVEGVGLIRKKLWAEWLTVVVTASFIPFEVFELARRFSAAKVVALALNVAIVAYLAWRRVNARRGGGERARRSPAAPLPDPERATALRPWAHYK